MALLVAEAHHLVLDRRAIARPLALDHSGVHRRAIDTAADYLVGARVGEREMAGDLRLRDRAVRNENGGGGSSPGWISSAE